MHDFNRKLIDSYLNLINNLDTNSKLELISRLSSSMKDSSIDNEESKSFQHLFGAFKTQKTAEELISNIKADRNFNRKIQDFD